MHHLSLSLASGGRGGREEVGRAASVATGSGGDGGHDMGPPVGAQSKAAPETPREVSSNLRQSQRRFHQRFINEDLHQDARCPSLREARTPHPLRGYAATAPSRPEDRARLHPPPYTARSYDRATLTLVVSVDLSHLTLGRIYIYEFLSQS